MTILVDLSASMNLDYALSVLNKLDTTNSLVIGFTDNTKFRKEPGAMFYASDLELDSEGKTLLQPILDSLDNIQDLVIITDGYIDKLDLSRFEKVSMYSSDITPQIIEESKILEYYK